MDVETAVAKFLEYLPEKEDPPDPKTVRYYERVVNRFTTGIPTTEVARLSEIDLLGAWKQLNNGTLRPRSQRVYREIVCLWLDWCVESNLLTHHRMRRLRCDKLDEALRPKVSLQRFSALLKAATSLDSKYESVRSTALLWTAWSALLRRAEVTALLLEDLRIEEDEPQILIRCGKGGKSAWLNLDVDAASALQAWKVVRGDPGHNALWCNEGAGRQKMGRDAYAKMLTRLGTIAEIDVRECKTHGIRRGSATAMLQRGMDIGSVSKALRHMNIQTTWDYVQADSLRLLEPSVRNWTSIALAEMCAEKEVMPTTKDLMAELLESRAAHAETKAMFAQLLEMMRRQGGPQQ